MEINNIFAVNDKLTNPLSLIFAIVVIIYYKDNNNNIVIIVFCKQNTQLTRAQALKYEKHRHVIIALLTGSIKVFRRAIAHTPKAS